MWNAAQNQILGDCTTWEMLHNPNFKWLHHLGNAALNQILYDYTVAIKYEYAVFLGDCNKQIWITNNLETTAYNQLSFVKAIT